MPELDPPDEPLVHLRRLEDAGPDPVIALKGELDLTGAPHVWTYLESHLVGTPARLIFDCSELRFMDSSGLVLLLELHERGVAVVLRNPTEMVRSVIETTGLTTVIELQP